MYALNLVISLIVCLVIFHHLIYPFSLRFLARNNPRAVVKPAPLNFKSVSIIVPVYNEAEVMQAKLENLKALHYKADKLDFILAFDGCTDDSLYICRSFLENNPEFAKRVTLMPSPYNLGKVARLNLAIKQSKAEIIILNDASAELPVNSVLMMVAGFENPNVGVVCPSYRIGKTGHGTEKGYWRYQGGIKRLEARLHSPIGAHGACYGFRRSLYTSLPLDTINDDVMIPMRMVAQGQRCLYLENLIVTELSGTPPQKDFERRVRLGAGNFQQVLRIAPLLKNASPKLIYLFACGKALRGLMPLLLVALIGLLLIGTAIEPMIYTPFLSCVAVLFCLAFMHLRIEKGLSGLLGLAAYATAGYYACFVGIVRYLKGDYARSWSGETATIGRKGFLPLSTRILKRSFDIIMGLIAFAVMVVLYLPLALLIKLESKGPVIYKQTRVGEATQTHTCLFQLYKFRTMRVDAESQSGPVWAKVGDPRVTRIGRFLRKSRLDELPQAINVLMGNMSVVGPRPERPNFFCDLEAAIPFYCERTYGIKPGITGLAQITTGYDSNVEDVRRKVLYDHVYALQLGDAYSWFKTDVGISLRTFGVMVLGLGR